MQKIIFTVAIFLFLFPTTILAQNNIEKETNPQSSIPTILVGLGIILIGIAFGIPVLKQQGTKINEADNN